MITQNFDEINKEKLVTFFKEFFKVHNIFTMDDSDVKEYLQKQASDNSFYAITEDEVVKAALFIVETSSTNDHKTYKLKHFGFSDDNDFKNLIDHVEADLKSSCDSIKIEVNLADTEEGIELYQTNGYAIEGTLMNHYRKNEIVNSLGKTL